MNRERVTVTIKKDLLDQLDRLVDGITIRSRSQAVEFLLSKTLVDHRIKTALILAGGPKEKETIGRKIKFLLPLNGTILIKKVIEQIASFGTTRFLIYSDNFKKELEEALLDSEYDIVFLENEDGKENEGNIEALRKIKNFVNETFLIVYGDVISSININDMLNFHKRHESKATIALTTVNNPNKYGVAEVKGINITNFIEKPKRHTDSFLINAGYFIFEPEILKYLSRDMKSIEKDLLPKIAKKGLLNAYIFQGRYVNVNTEEDFKRARLML